MKSARVSSSAKQRWLSRFAASTTTGRYVALLPVARSEVDAQMRARWDGSEWLIHGNPLTWKFYDGDLAATQVVLWDGKG